MYVKIERRYILAVRRENSIDAQSQVTDTPCHFCLLLRYEMNTTPISAERAEPPGKSTTSMSAAESALRRDVMEHAALLRRYNESGENLKGNFIFTEFDPGTDAQTVLLQRVLIRQDALHMLEVTVNGSVEVHLGNIDGHTYSELSSRLRDRDSRDDEATLAHKAVEELTGDFITSVRRLIAPKARLDHGSESEKMMSQPVDPA